MNRQKWDARLIAPVIGTNILASVVAEAERAGVDPQPWFQDLGITPGQMQDASVRISYRQAHGVLKRALPALARPDLGLRIGQRQNVGTFGVLGLAMLTARTFGESLAISIEHHRLTGSLVDLEFEPISAEQVAVQVLPRHHDPELLPFLCEELLSSCLMVCRALVGPDFRPDAIELAYPAPGHADDYTRLFGCPVRFNAGGNRALVSCRWLATELPSHNPISAQQALALCREQSAQRPSGHDVADAVARLLRHRVAQNPLLVDIARALNLTERTLRRQLRAAGVGFKQLHDRIRRDHAARLLRRADLTIAEIGAAVGFRDVREFRRAFKRWTGLPPRAMRDG